MRNLVKAVNAPTNTVQIISMRTKRIGTYKIDELTSILVNKLPAKITDIKAGLQVRDYVERDAGTLDLISVDKADAPPQ